ASAILDAPELAQKERPDLWPECTNIAAAFAERRGFTAQPLGRYEHDEAVKRMVAWLAAGYSSEDLRAAIERACSESWAKDLPLAALFSAKVIGRNRPRPLAQARPRAMSEAVARALAEVEREDARRAG